MDEEHLDELAENIRKHGQQVSIELLDGLILDGRRRYLACKKLGINPRIIEVNPEDPVDYVISLNLHRRHLTAAEKAMAAADAIDLKDKYAEEARKRQLSGLMKGKEKSVAPPAGQREIPGRTAQKMGEAFGISSSTVEAGMRIKKRGSPALNAAVKSGYIPISTAEEISIKSHKDQDIIVNRIKQDKKEGKKPPSRESLRNERRKEKPHPSIAHIPDGGKGKGVLIACEAINLLKRIPKNDPLRLDGFNLVIKWIKDNR